MDDDPLDNLSPLEVHNHRSQITQTLRAAVLAGEMKVGETYSAPRLAVRFGVSATPVREAMIDLAKEGMVEVLRNKGFRVAQPSHDELKQMMEVRLLLEVPTVRALARIGLAPPQRAELQRLAEESLRSAERNDLMLHVLTDIQFHIYLLSLGGNQELVNIVRVLRSRSRLYGLGSKEKRSFLLESAQHHVTLVSLLAERKEAEAGDLMDMHIRRAAAEWSTPEFSSEAI